MKRMAVLETSLWSLQEEVNELNEARAPANVKTDDVDCEALSVVLQARENH